MVTPSSHRCALDVPIWFSLNGPRPLGVGPGAGLPSCGAALDLVRVSGTLSFMKRWCCQSFWPCWVWVVERNVLLGNQLVFFPLCSGPNSPMLEQCPGGDGEGWGLGKASAGREAQQAQKQAVVCPYT